MKLKHCITLGLLSSALLISGFANAADTSATSIKNYKPAEVKKVQAIIHDYLLNHPEVVMEGVRKLRQKQIALKQAKTRAIIKANQQSLFHSSVSPVGGNLKGNVTVVEFFDYQCGHCKKMIRVIDKVLDHEKGVKVIYKEFPIFPGSEYASKAALAAQPQGKYLEFHKALMSDKNPLSKEDVLRLAKKVGLNVNQLKNDMKSKAILQELQNNKKMAKEIGIKGTPALVIQNTKMTDKIFFIPGAMDHDRLVSYIKEAS